MAKNKVEEEKGKTYINNLKIDFSGLSAISRQANQEQ